MLVQLVHHYNKGSALIGAVSVTVTVVGITVIAVSDRIRPATATSIASPFLAR